MGMVTAVEMASDSAVTICFVSAAVKEELAMLPTTPSGLLKRFCGAPGAHRVRHQLRMDQNSQTSMGS